MDPKANLEEQRRTARRILRNADCENQEAATDQLIADGVRLAELVEGLDGWMRKGGFSPWK